MWSVISKLFTKTDVSSEGGGAGDGARIIALPVSSPRHDDGDGEQEEEKSGTMDRRDVLMEPQDMYDTRQAKQRASVKWLLSKAYNNKVPENLREPFYRDLENQEHLKPQIVVALANADLYCLALSNIYSDPNYHTRNHWFILQTLSRKGVQVRLQESPDTQLTETILMKTNPLRLNAHMAVIESIMVLYAKEVVTADRVLAAVHRFTRCASDGDTNGGPASLASSPSLDHERGLLLWVSHACSALEKRANQSMPTVKDWKDLCDGVGLGALVSFYCPDELPWSELLVSPLPTVPDSLHNLTLVYNFCQRNLPPSSVFHMLPEDITYMRGSMKQNLVVFLADMFNVLELHPVRCVRYPGMDRSASDAYPARNSQGVVHKRSLLQSVVTPIPDLRSGIDDLSQQAGAFTSSAVARSPPAHVSIRKSHSAATAGSAGPASPLPLQHSTSDLSEDSLMTRFRDRDDSSFVVHRGRGVPTLSSVVSQSTGDEPLLPARLRPAKEKQNADTKAEERGDGKGGGEVAAGRPSNWEDSRKMTYAGRRSRRNSTSDDSQLTIENFGGSQDRLNFIGRNPDKEVAVVHVGRKISAPAGPFPVAEANVAVRSSLKDARGSIQFGYDDSDGEKQDSEKENYKIKRKLSGGGVVGDDPSAATTAAVSLKNILQHSRDAGNANADFVDGEVSSPGSKLASFAELSKNKSSSSLQLADYQQPQQKGIQIVYMQQQHDKDQQQDANAGGQQPSKSSFLNRKATTNGSETASEKKITTFATLPNTTTWQQQHHHQQQQQAGGDTQPASSSHRHHHPTTDADSPSAQLNDIRLKLEEKRRHIENEKRKMEIVMSKQRQKVGKAAFLQAVTKGKGNFAKTPTDSEASSSTPGSQAQSPLAPEAAPSKPQRPFTLQEITEDAMSVEHKWLDKEGGAPFVETRRTPDIEGMDLEQYQQSIAQMNTSLHDIQADIQRLATQQNQIQVSQQQAYLAEQHKQQMQALAMQQQQHQRYQQQQQSQHYPLQSYGSAPHLPQALQQYSHHLSTSPRLTSAGTMEPQFYLHDQQSPLSQPQRRTWAQQAQGSPDPANLYQQQQQTSEMRTWSKPHHHHHNSSGFLLHESPDRFQDAQHAQYQNGEHNNHVSFTLSQQHHHHHQHPAGGAQSLFPGSGGATPPPHTVSPQHRGHLNASSSSVHRQISQLMGADVADKRSSPVAAVNLQQLSEPYADTGRGLSGARGGSVVHAPIPTPPVDDMEPQNISFIGNAADDASDTVLLSQGIGKLNITSGTRTYRIPSPTRPAILRNSFQQHLHQQQQPLEGQELLDDSCETEADATNEKGFYISFDNEQPKRPKPPLRTKRASPKKERSLSSYDPEEEAARETGSFTQPAGTARERHRQLERELQEERHRQSEREAHRQHQERLDRERQRGDRQRGGGDATSQEREGSGAPSAAIIIQAQADPNSIDEMERKKEKILMMSLQRRQQQEEAKERKEMEALARREREKAKEEERQRKKEEQIARRAAILQHHKRKKAIEEAEREGKVLDKSELMGGTMKGPGAGGSSGAATKLRGKGAPGRPRPKTIHVDSGSVEMAEGMLQPSQGKKGSTSNLTASPSSYTSSTMRRDYYRGSTDSLADRRMNSGMYRDSPDDSRGMSPCPSVNPSLGRRSSYKTSREAQEPGQIRGRPKYATYQNFKGRKSNSLMNLCVLSGSSSDQDSMAYRCYGDTDSGLGRATPPRRAPSPGMGHMRHLPSPSGPGSLPPGLVTKRRMFDDGSSDISSTPSSMMDYTGPRLYKQPATKSNRGIMLNAVEYCVFPGVVNKEAKQRVLEEIARSESKHFLILFRDAGCQFRALYSYCPDRDEVLKLYGTGPKQVNDRMFDKFFKYNSGGKCFSQVHTKHLTVTIDAFTIHNSLWQGKKVNLPNKKDMALVI